MTSRLRCRGFQTSTISTTGSPVEKARRAIDLTSLGISAKPNPRSSDNCSRAAEFARTGFITSFRTITPSETASNNSSPTSPSTRSELPAGGSLENSCSTAFDEERPRSKSPRARPATRPTESASQRFTLGTQCRGGSSCLTNGSPRPCRRSSTVHTRVTCRSRSRHVALLASDSKVGPRDPHAFEEAT
ncbi:MAG: hypothetical protein QOG54_1443 [Actinomycetota bacterium]|nr:hypothetical protein [Actinomycetota bacterium]